jgi:hypothetical protein
MTVAVMCDHCGERITEHKHTEDYWTLSFKSVELANFTLHLHPACGVDLLGAAVPKGYATAIRHKEKQVIR